MWLLAALKWLYEGLVIGYALLFVLGLTVWWSVASLVGWLLGRVLRSRRTAKEAGHWRARMGEAATYEEWAVCAKELDALSGADKWKEYEVTDLLDHQLIRMREQR